LATRYDDGGFSGGNMERPALQVLLARIAAPMGRTEAGPIIVSAEARAPGGTAAAPPPGVARSCRSTATAMPIAPRRRFDQRLEIDGQGRVPGLRRGRLLTIAGLPPAPGRRTRAEGSSCANSFRLRPIVLGAIPVACATAAIPP
jgi:hypothetical protein